MNPILVIDYETSAFPEKGGAPINFAAALLDKDTFEVKAQFECFMLLEGDDVWDPGAERVHHISREYLKQHAVSREQGYEDFIAWMRSIGLKPTPECESWDRVHLCGHNVEFFDQGILSGEKGIGRELFKKWFHYRVIDTMKVAFFLDMVYYHAGHGHVFTTEGQPSVKLGALQRMYNIKSGLAAHTAIGDVLTTAEALRKMDKTFSGGLKMLERLGEFRKAEASMTDEELGKAARAIFGARKK